MQKLVLTGAAGRLGSWLREPLSKLADSFVSTDIVENIDNLYPGERYQKANLESLDEMMSVIEGADMVVHFGAIGDERPFEELLGPNFVGAYNVWEAAYRHKVKRVIYASSIHAVGMHDKSNFIGIDAPHRPDTFYGLAKCFTEDLGRMYFEKRQLESVHLRILSCAQVNNSRALGTWLSYEDLIQLVTRAIDTPVTGFSVVYGVSNNDRAPVDNAGASHLGYRPKDNAEQFADEVFANEAPVDPHSVRFSKHGGPFAETPLGESGVASMNIVDDTKT